LNVAVGYQALLANSSGSNNIGIGESAGAALTNGSNNIELGNQGTSGDSATIRIGTPGTHAATYIAGITSTPLTGAAVYVSASGQLGVLASSERFKTDIAALPAAGSKLEKLRPVTFHLRSEPHGVVQYGLIAEEVDKVYPELVIRDSAGRIQGVRYDELSSILLREVQAQTRQVAQQDARFDRLEKQQRDTLKVLTQLVQENRALRAAASTADSRPARLAAR
jgi:Chaperone of endosialidase